MTAKPSDATALPRVSVIVPVYKTEHTVARAIDSVLSQTLQDFEIICVNDGSPDKAEIVLAEYAARDTRIRVITQENRGLSGARNAGLDVARGEYIAFLDSDDALPRYALEVMVGEAVRLQAPIVISERPVDVKTDAAMAAAMTVSEPAACRVRVTESPLKDVIAGTRMRSSAWNKLYLRSTIGTRRFIEGIYFEDWPFVTTLLATIGRAVILSAPCYVYSKMGSSIVRSDFDEKKIVSYERGIRAVASELRGTPAWPLARKRCALAASMMINKVYCGRDRNLRSALLSRMDALSRGVDIRLEYLNVKALLRLWTMRYCEGARCVLKKVIKHNNVKYRLGCLTVLTRRANRTRHGARLGYYLFSKVPIWCWSVNAIERARVQLPVPHIYTQIKESDLLVNALRSMEPFTYIPNPGNAGDALIAAATLSFFDRHGLNYRMFDGDCSGNVVLGGGGALVSQSPKFIQRVLRTTKKSERVLILPSTFRDVDDFVDTIDSRFVVFARDRESYKYLCERQPAARVCLDHDMTLYLTDDLFAYNPKVSILERELHDRMRNDFAGGDEDVRIMRTDNESANCTTTGLDLSKYYYLDEYSCKDWIIYGAQIFLETVGRFKVVITDRLHVGIATILTGGNLQWVDDRYHKIKGIYEYEFRNLSNVRFSADVSCGIVK